MSEGKTQVERLLDVLVYAPAGLVQSAAEEFDRLAEKGRHRVEGQLHTARLVGQFAVQMARREAGKRFRGALDTVARGQRGGPSGAGATARPGEGASRTLERGRGARGASAEAPEAPAEAASEWGNSRSSPDSNGAESASKLAIPGYDSLSASHVVQRLGGLSHDELEEVRDHELAHRHRRTILNRVEQLLSDGGAGTGTAQS